MIKKKSHLVILFTFLFIFTVTNFVIHNTYSNSKESSEDKLSLDENSFISFSDYQKLFEYLTDNIKIDGLEIKYFSKHDNIHIIDPLWSFNTRKDLLLTNLNIIQPTEEFLILENQSSECQITISICYTENFIGNNMHCLVTPNTDLDINKTLSINTNSAILSYKNLIISIQQGRSNPDIDYLLSCIDELVNTINDYFK